MRSNRGSQESLDSVVRTLTRLKSSGVSMGTAGEYTGVYAIQALLGIRPADPDSVVPVNGTAGFAEASPSVRAESRWTAAVNALVRKDSVALRRHLEALRVDTGAHASIAARSVVGIARGLAGDTRTAAESLLVLEREHGDRRPKVWGAFAADRLLAAQWLTGVRRYEAADSLLRFTRGWALNGGGTLSVVAGPIHLQRSRIAEGRGDSAKAVEHARIFLATYDLAGPAAAGWFEEARGRITRLGGSLDGFPAREAPVRR